jgi:hypothetical protein
MTTLLSNTQQKLNQLIEDELTMDLLTHGVTGNTQEICHAN